MVKPWVARRSRVGCTGTRLLRVEAEEEAWMRELCALDILTVLLSATD